MSCPTCGGVVEDHVCTNCGAAVWPTAPDAGDDVPATPPPPPSAGGGQARPTFVNPPEADRSPPPPPPPVAPAASGWQPSSVPPPSAGASSSGSSSKVLWWVLGGVGVLAVLGVVAVLLVLRSVDLDGVGSVGEGSPERLAILWENCDAGDMQACDDLYLESPIDSPEEAFGDSCGGRNEPSGWCVDIHGDTAAPN